MIFESLAYSLGLLPIKQLHYVRTNNAALREQVRAHGTVSPYICASRKPGFFGRGISGRTKSWTQHSGLAVPREAAERVRRNHPDLLGSRILPGSVPRSDGYNWPLPAVSDCRHDVEVIESQATIAINDFSAVTRDSEQVILFLRDWTPEQEDAILYAAYYLYGAPYDVFEIAGHEFVFFNPKKIYVCSSYVTHALRGRDPINPGTERGDNRLSEWFRVQDIDISRCWPHHAGVYLLAAKLYHNVLAFNCFLDEAMAKI